MKRGNKIHWTFAGMVVISAPLGMVVWSALIDGNQDAMTALWVCGGILLFLAGGATVLIGQVMSARMGKAMFETNSKENVALMQALVAANKAVVSNNKNSVGGGDVVASQSNVRIIENESTPIPPTASAIVPTKPDSAVVIGRDAFKGLEN